MQKSKVSIITPIYGTNMFYFKQCVESFIVFSHNKPPNIEFEWIVVIDGDDRPIENWLSKWQKEINIISFKVLRLKKNKGLAFARNIATKNLDTDYISWLDADDVLNVKEAIHFYQEGVECLKSNEDIVLIYSDNIETDSSLVPQFIRRKSVLHSYYEEYKDCENNPLFYIDYIYQSQLIRYKDFLEVGGFKKGIIGEDVEFILKLATFKCDKYFFHMPLVPYIYRNNPKGIVNRYYRELRKQNALTYRHYAKKAKIYCANKVDFNVLYLNENKGILSKENNNYVFFNCFTPIGQLLPHYIKI